MLHSEAEAALDVYFRQCAIEVTCRDLAVMGGIAVKHRGATR